MTLPIIALIVSVVGLVSSVILYKINNKSDDKINQASIKSVNRKLEYLEKNVQLLLDKHEEEQELKEIETRKAHWKSFNTWKIQKGMMNQDAGDRPICGACYNDSLELVINYEKSKHEPYYASGTYVGHLFAENDYPLSAEQKCTICGHVADKWEYED